MRNHSGGLRINRPHKRNYQRNGAKVIIEPRKGYGRAYKTGFSYANGDIIVTLDGDYSYSAFLIQKFVKMLETYRLDFNKHAEKVYS